MLLEPTQVVGYMDTSVQLDALIKEFDESPNNLWAVIDLKTDTHLLIEQRYLRYDRSKFKTNDTAVLCFGTDRTANQDKGRNGHRVKLITLFQRNDPLPSMNLWEVILLQTKEVFFVYEHELRYRSN